MSFFTCCFLHVVPLVLRRDVYRRCLEVCFGVYLVVYTDIMGVYIGVYMVMKAYKGCIKGVSFDGFTYHVVHEV